MRKLIVGELRLGLTTLSVEVAQALAKCEGRLYLDGLTTLSVDVALALAMCKGTLHLDGLTSLSDEAAEVLGKYGDGKLTVDFDKLPAAAGRILRDAGHGT